MTTSTRQTGEGDLGALRPSDFVPGELVERLEVASVGSRELDCAIGLALDGFFILPPRYEGDAPRYAYRKDGTEVHPGQGGTMLVWPYTTSLDAALALAERVLPGWHVTVSNHYCFLNLSSLPSAVVSQRVDETNYDGTTAQWSRAQTMPLALCIAILKARSDGVNT